jgi:hypothetical protein
MKPIRPTDTLVRGITYAQPRAPIDTLDRAVVVLQEKIDLQLVWKFCQ